jgi:hypothetical protein
MAEEQGVQGNIWLDKSIKILKSLGWVQHGSKNVDMHIPGKKDPTGIDAYFTYYDPYESQVNGVFVDGKRYEWKGVWPSTLKPMILKMSDDISEVPLTEDFKIKFDEIKENIADIINAGLIIMWIYDTEDTKSKYNYNEFQGYLQAEGYRLFY